MKTIIAAALFGLVSMQVSAATLYEKYDSERDVAISVSHRDGYLKKMRKWKAKDGFTPITAATCIDRDNTCLTSAAELAVNAPYAYRGLYQAQRNLAFCLESGCNGAIIANEQLGCAWRIIILAAGHIEADTSDQMSLKTCLAKLSPAQIATAKAQAAKLYKTVYSKDISADWR